MTDQEKLTAVQYGIGPIGSRIARAARSTGAEFVGAVDTDPQKVGRDLGDVADFDDSVGVEVRDEPEAALAAGPDVVFHSTVSSLENAASQLERAVRAGANVVSTTEELAYPWQSNAEAAEHLDGVATENGVTVVGAGINPGFVMDAMPAVLSTPMAAVERVTVHRIQDAAQRREPLQTKVGAGLSPERFETDIATEAGHVGSTESVAMLADALGFAVEDTEEVIEPVLADERVETEYVTVEPGEVAGIRQIARGYDSGEPVITLDLQMYVGADEPRDHVEFEGEPEVSVTVDGGFHGDVSTAAVVANVAPSVVAADPGLLSMTELPTPSFTRQA